MNKNTNNNTTPCNKKSLMNLESDDEESHSPNDKISFSTSVRETIWVDKEKNLFRKRKTDKIKKTLVKNKKRTGVTNVIREIVDTKTELETYRLREISVGELSQVKIYGIPLFIMKEGSRYFYSYVPYNFKLIGTMKEEHLCAPHGTVCDRLSPCSDEEGGCQKVRDDVKHLEKYDWITKGYETINTEDECFVVLNCKHHIITPPRKAPNSLKNETKLDLARFLWDDVDSVEDMKKRIQKNLFD